MNFERAGHRSGTVSAEAEQNVLLWAKIRIIVPFGPENRLQKEVKGYGHSASAGTAAGYFSDPKVQSHVSANRFLKVSRRKNVSFSRWDPCLKVRFDSLRYLMVHRHILAGVEGLKSFFLYDPQKNRTCRDAEIH